MDQASHDALKQETRDLFANATTLELAKHMKAIQQDKEKLEEELSRVNTMYDVVRMEMIPAKMEEEGIERVAIEGVGLLYLSADLNASIPADKKQEAYTWLDENGYGSLITNTVNSSTLKAFCKEQIKKGTELPDGMFKVTPFVRAAIRKA